MNSFNPIINQYLLDIPYHQKEIMEVLRNLILNAAPGIEETYNYKIPFYNYHSWLCYLNKTKNGVDLSFTKGNQLSNSQGLLEYRNRKLIASIEIRSLQEFYEKEMQLHEILQEAILINQTIKSSKKIK